MRPSIRISRLHADRAYPVPGSVVSSSSTQFIVNSEPGTSSSTLTTPATSSATQSSSTTTTSSGTSRPPTSSNGLGTSTIISQTNPSESQAPTSGASAVPPRRSSTALVISLATTLSVITVAAIVLLCYWKRHARARKLSQLEAHSEGPALVEPFTGRRTMVEKREELRSEEDDSDVTASSVAVFPTRRSMLSTAAEPLSRRSMLGRHGDDPHAPDSRPVARPDPGALKRATPASSTGFPHPPRAKQSPASAPSPSATLSSSESPAYSTPPPALDPGSAGVVNMSRALPPLPQNVVVSSALGTGPDGRERLVELPWYLGERLLAFLASAPPSGRPESTVGPSETLPAYEPQR
ncbi:hypothetical protein C8Q79DRAFT_735522 [Trametes meyenii]|nr:hypothetical protein C8Q79DRAFT_735522 [Trametes meyenii]